MNPLWACVISLLVFLVALAIDIHKKMALRRYRRLQDIQRVKWRLLAVIAADRAAVPCGRWVWRGFRCTDVGTAREKCVDLYRWSERR